MLNGIGDVYAKTTGLAGGATAQRIIELFLFDFEFTQESEALEAQAYIGGVRRSKGSAEASVTSTLRISTQYADWAQLGFAFNAFPVTATNVTVPVLKRVNVPTSSPFEIADPEITASTAAGVFAYVNSRGTWGQPGALTRAATPATPAAGQVGVDGTANKLIFHSSQAGAPITYTVPETLATVQTLGGPAGATKYGKLELWGKIYSPESTDGNLIYFPELTRQSRPSVSFAGDVPTLEITFTCGTPAGWDEPFRMVNLDTAT